MARFNAMDGGRSVRDIAAVLFRRQGQLGDGSKGLETHSFAQRRRHEVAFWMLPILERYSQTFELSEAGGLVLEGG